MAKKITYFEPFGEDLFAAFVVGLMSKLGGDSEIIRKIHPASELIGAGGGGFSTS